MDVSQELFNGPSFDLGFDDDLKDEGAANIDKSMQQFDLNNLPNEVVYLVNAGSEDAKNSSVNNQVVQPFDRAFFDLNKSVLDLNKFPYEGLVFGLENEELGK